MTLNEIIEADGFQPSKEEVKYPRLRLITGGKGPPTTGSDWLSALKRGAVFTCKRKGLPDLELLIIAFKHAKTIVLVDGLNQSPRKAWDPVEFCKLYSLFEIIEEGGQLPEGEENDSSGTV